MHSFIFQRWFAPELAVLVMLLSLGYAPLAVSADFKTVRVGSGFNRPVFAASPKGDRERLFVLEQHTGEIKILFLNSGAVAPTPFLTVPGLSKGNEQGLLGLAFDPNYATNGHFYVNFNDTTGTSEIRRYQVSATNPDVADAASALTILRIPQPQINHNGGWIGFGPDGYLYVSVGDGGSAYDSGNGHTPDSGNAQDITDNLLGKILRLDVNGDDFPADPQRNYAIPPGNPFVGVTGDDEIWAYGLRNPWRCSFDRATGDLYIGDVGQSTREEIDVQPSGSSGGENYGWRLREGSIETPSVGVGGLKPPGAIDPVYDYSHGTGALQGFSITGGYVYRGPVASLYGAYFFADAVNPRIWSFRYDGSDPMSFDGTNFTDFLDRTSAIVPDAGSIGGAVYGVTSFAEDDLGNLYILDFDGEIFRLQADSAARVPIPPLALLALGAVLGGIGWVRRPR